MPAASPAQPRPSKARPAKPAQSQTRRNKGFDETHRDMIETAVRLISEKGVEALSLAELSRAMGINRTTIYYHFDSREALIDAVKAWSSEQLAKGLSAPSPQQERVDHITRFVLDNPALIKLWIDDFISGGDIRGRYPLWDDLVSGIGKLFAERIPEDDADAEVFCVLMLTSAFIAPRVFKNSVRPDASVDEIVERFRREQQRLLKQGRIVD